MDESELQPSVSKKPRQQSLGTFFRSVSSKPSDANTSGCDVNPVQATQLAVSIATVQQAGTSTERPVDVTPTPEQLPLRPDLEGESSNKNTDTAACENDIANALNLRNLGKLTSEKKLYFIRSTLKVEYHFKFPFSVNSNRRYYVSYKHISGVNNCFYFSPHLSGLLCLPCVLFAPDKVGRGNSQSVGRLVIQPLVNFNKLTGKDSYLESHIRLDYHEDAVMNMNALEESTATGDVSTKVNTQSAQQIARNRMILGAILVEIETCGSLNLALRGHRDSGPIDCDVDIEHIDYTQGNLRCLVQKAATRNSILNDHLKNGPKNASYLSPKTQNNLIDCIGKVMLRQITDKIRKAKYFSIGADETSDIHKIEQLVMTVRYVDNNHDICDDFVGFIEVNETTGKALADTILDHLSKLGLDKSFMVAQGYDGASAMSGIFNGTQAIVRQQCPSAVYVHCALHCLNLVLKNACEIPEITAAVTGIQRACQFFKNSTKRVTELEQAVERFCPESSHKRLKQYCATRWVERHDSVFVFLELYEPLIDVFISNKEFALVNTITEPSFLVATLILSHVLGETKSASVKLQAKEIDLVGAITEIDSVVETLKSWREDEMAAKFVSIFQSATAMYAKRENDPTIEIPKPRLAIRQRNRNNVPTDSAMEFYRRAVWLPFLDTMLSQFAERFNSQAKIVMGMCTIIPSQCVDSNVSQFLKASSIYGQFLDGGSAACEIEYGRWQRKWAKIAKSERPETVVGALKNCDATIYPNIAILLQIFATIPVTTATAERSFSALRLLKTYLRATMKEERLNGLALMAIRKDIQFKHDEVIDQYASEHNRRFKFD